MLLNSRELKFLENYKNVYGKLSAKREYREAVLFIILKYSGLNNFLIKFIYNFLTKN